MVVVVGCMHKSSTHQLAPVNVVPLRRSCLHENFMLLLFFFFFFSAGILPFTGEVTPLIEIKRGGRGGRVPAAD